MKENNWLWFTGVNMYLISGPHVRKFPAVSGKPTLENNQPGVRSAAKFPYSRARQEQKNTGPLPSGSYFITLSSVITYAHTGATYRNAALAALILQNPMKYLENINLAWGKMSRASGRIIPIFSANGSKEYAYGRNNAWIHGSHSPGSIGCIDMMGNMDHFLRNLEALKFDPNKKFPLKVLYGLGPEGLEPSELDLHWNDISNIA